MSALTRACFGGWRRLSPTPWKIPMLLLLLATLLLSACGQPAASPTAAPAKATEPPKPAAAATAAPAAAPTAAKPAAPTAGAKPAPVTVKVGMLPTNLGNAGFLIANARGYFAEQGITNEILTFDGGTRMVAPLATGDIDVGMGGLGAALYNAITREIPMRVVADNGSSPPGAGWQSLVVRKELYDSGVRKLSDLKGKNIALSSMASSGEVTYEKMLEKTGLTDKDVEIVLLNFPDQIAALGNGRLDTALLIEPLLTTAIENGSSVILAGVDEINPGQQLAGVMYAANFTTKNEDAAKRWMIAYVKGVREYLDAVGPKKKNQEQVAKILSDAKLVKDLAFFQKMKAVGLNPDGRVNRQSLDDDQTIYVRKGEMKEKIDLSRAVDNSYVDNAVKVLGPYQP